MPGSVVGLDHGPVGVGVLSRYGIRGTVTCETAGEPALDCISRKGNQCEFQMPARNQPCETDIPSRSASVHCPSTVYNTNEKAQACWLSVNNNNRVTQCQTEQAKCSEKKGTCMCSLSNSQSGGSTTCAKEKESLSPPPRPQVMASATRKVQLVQR